MTCLSQHCMEMRSASLFVDNFIHLSFRMVSTVSQIKIWKWFHEHIITLEWWEVIALHNSGQQRRLLKILKGNLCNLYCPISIGLSLHCDVKSLVLSKSRSAPGSIVRHTGLLRRFSHVIVHVYEVGLVQEWINWICRVTNDSIYTHFRWRQTTL